MNLLVTNTQCAQAYSIIRELRQHAAKIVATMNGKYWIQARTAHAANSRYVDKRYHVPSPEDDWLAGNIQPENTEKEEAYVQRIEQICRIEKIDTIFPSYDPDVYILAKNKPRFEKQVILVIAPDYSKLLTSLDKYQSVKAAQRAGFPCPKFYLPESVEDLKKIGEEIGPPWVIKPRFTAGSKGTTIVSKRHEFEETFVAIAREHHKPMIQEFIPGKGRQNFYIVADRNSEILSLFCPRVVRISKRLFRNSSAASIVSTDTPYRAEVQSLVREVGWQGGLTVQTKIDARDGIPKLMEINPRLGSHLWYRTEAGINEPLMCLQLARGETLHKTENPPNGAILLEPLDDMFGFGFELLDLVLYRIRTLLFGALPTDKHNPPLTLGSMFKEYLNNYFNERQKIICPHTRYLFSDPLPCLLWYYAFMGYSLRGIKERGK